jgi:DNA-binding transcriptional regulator YhcF (GntR family)
MLEAVESNQPILPLSQKALKQDLNLNLRTIRRSLDLLEGHKLIQRNERRTKVLVSCITQRKQLERLQQELACPSSN